MREKASERGRGENGPYQKMLHDDLSTGADKACGQVRELNMFLR